MNFRLVICAAVLVGWPNIVIGRRYEWEDEDTIIVEATREEDRENVLLERTGLQSQKNDFLQELFTKLPTKAFGGRNPSGAQSHRSRSRGRQGRAYQTHQSFPLTCYSLLGDQGHCTTFRECFPMLYYTEGEHEGHIKHPVLADLLMSTSGPCLASPFSFRDDFVPYESSEEQQKLQSSSSSFSDPKDLICCPSDKPSPVPPVSAIRVTRPPSTTVPPTVKPKPSDNGGPSDAVAAILGNQFSNMMGLETDPIPRTSTTGRPMAESIGNIGSRPAPGVSIGHVVTEEELALVGPANTAEEDSEELGILNVVIPPHIRETEPDGKPPSDISVPIDFGPGEIGVVVDSSPEIKEKETTTTTTGRPVRPAGPPAPDVSAGIDYSKPKPVLTVSRPTQAVPDAAVIQGSKPSSKPALPQVSETTTKYPVHVLPQFSETTTKYPVHMLPQIPETSTRHPVHALPQIPETSTKYPDHALPQISETSSQYPDHALPQIPETSSQYPDHALPQISDPSMESPKPVLAQAAETTTEYPIHILPQVPEASTEASKLPGSGIVSETPAINESSEEEVQASIEQITGQLIQETTTTTLRPTTSLRTTLAPRPILTGTYKPKLPVFSRSPCGRLNSTSDPQHPWVVAIKLGPRFICAGSLIDEYHIMTAAHCIAGLSTLDIGRLRVYLGERILNTNVDGPTIIRKVTRAMRHRGFSISTLRNDIALLKLSLPIPVGTKRVRPICLPLDSDKNLMLETSSEASIVGWAPNWNELANDYTHENKYKVWANDGCMDKYRAYMPAIQIEDSMLCANLDLHPKGLLNLEDIGSDGSPVIIRDRYGIYQQIGISSWRLGPSPVYPRVLTRVSSFQSWLQKNRVRP